MPRGGRRPGAGRKRTLSGQERLVVGVHCERLLQDEWEAAKQKAIELATPAIREEWGKARAIPVAERKKWIGSFADKDHRDNVEMALDEERGTTVTPIRVRRPKGVRKDIINQVADERGVSLRMVETCWKEYRALQKHLREDPDLQRFTDEDIDLL